MVEITLLLYMVTLKILFAKTESELEKLAPTNEGKIEITGTNSIGINVHTEKRDNKDVWGFVGINNERATLSIF